MDVGKWLPPSEGRRSTASEEGEGLESYLLILRHCSVEPSSGSQIVRLLECWNAGMLYERWSVRVIALAVVSRTTVLSFKCTTNKDEI